MKILTMLALLMVAVAAPVRADVGSETLADFAALFGGGSGSSDWTAGPWMRISASHTGQWISFAPSGHVLYIVDDNFNNRCTMHLNFGKDRSFESIASWHMDPPTGGDNCVDVWRARLSTETGYVMQ